ncbi:PRELI domain-containing protein 2 isoform X2 [Callorhinchus milii]|uniref:PRELI domain-containing protein 2 isoform X2 n=1 Tax=Callorhinchus milii TaxID=7868 RepID=UPI0004572AC7|nr:PRELI domain-containing protein 2 isoform X2 [Callorhinchus milii]|eukprot:gi/632966618/ref/XP_007899518.1/ PREDICTED: PRELI domain-containing protein 2 isoform X2 [Callorhinchus milii]
MVIAVQIRRMYRYPFENVVDTHLNKYPTPLEKHITDVKIIEEKTDASTGVVYRRSLATCSNVIPLFLRRFQDLKVNCIHLEEESWLDMRQRIMNVKSRCVSWTHYATLREESVFKASVENPNWTEFAQHGKVSVTGVGPFNGVLELFAQTFLNRVVKQPESF